MEAPQYPSPQAPSTSPSKLRPSQGPYYPPLFLSVLPLCKYVAQKRRCSICTTCRKCSTVEKFKSVKATRGRDPYNVAGEFWCIVVVVDGDGVEGLHGVGVVVDGESVVGGVLPRLRPL